MGDVTRTTGRLAASAGGYRQPGGVAMLEGDVTRIQHLRNTNREWVTLERRHQELEDELGTFAKRRTLTTDEEMHKKTVQKQKLETKDRMNDLLRRSLSSVRES
jgi:uncharacterized protein YdcH (DUF465 family)